MRDFSQNSNHDAAEAYGFPKSNGNGSAAVNATARSNGNGTPRHVPRNGSGNASAQSRQRAVSHGDIDPNEWVG